LLVLGYAPILGGGAFLASFARFPIRGTQDDVSSVTGRTDARTSKWRVYLFLSLLCFVASFLIGDPSLISSPGGFKMFAGDEANPAMTCFAFIVGISWIAVAAAWETDTNPLYAMSISSLWACMFAVLASLAYSMADESNVSINALNFSESIWIMCMTVLLVIVTLCIVIFTSVGLQCDILMILSAATIAILPCQHNSPYAPPVSDVQIGGLVLMIVVMLGYKSLCSDDKIITQCFGRRIWWCDKCGEQAALAYEIQMRGNIPAANVVANGLRTRL
jgi:hypothetical protein